ncbi:Spermatogenesis-associated protein 31E1 [Manis javanica]|nr:Spermatogenesis-associated protein 31E1 [Manis javanica]
MEVNETWSQPVMFLVPQHHLERNGKKKYKKRSGSLKACREFLRDLGEIKDLLLLLRSGLRRLPDNGDSQMSSPEQPKVWLIKLSLECGTIAP